jgi:hypothetical protein
MDPIESAYTMTVSTKRLLPISGTDKEEYQTNIASLRCIIQPDEIGRSQDIDGQFGKNFIMMCPLADVKEGDRIIYLEEEYSVVGAENYSFLSHSHMELELRQRIA